MNEDDQKRWGIAHHRQGPCLPNIQDLDKWVVLGLWKCCWLCQYIEGDH